MILHWIIENLNIPYVHNSLSIHSLNKRLQTSTTVPRHLYLQPQTKESKSQGPKKPSYLPTARSILPSAASQISQRTG